MHKQYLLAALEQAKLGSGLCAPNPCVGAVAVQDEMIIAQTHHCGAGTPHAEVLLLEQIPKNIPGITMYVTLEPCNHWGKTPPCVDVIIQHGVCRVVYAYRDPNPLVNSGNTPKILSDAGIEVLYYPLPEIDTFYKSYKYWVTTKKPWVTVKIAQTFDGKIAAEKGVRVNLSNDLCAQFTHTQRAAADIILTTARTINQDDPLFTARTETIRQKNLAIIDLNSTLNLNAKALQQSSGCHVYSYPSQQDRSHAACNFHTLTTPKNNSKLGLSKFILEEIINHLGELGYHLVWVEAGSVLFNALHSAALVNTTYIYLVPAVLGDKCLSLYHNANIFKRSHTIKWQAMGNNMIASFDWEPLLT